eukprot:1144923-Pelagomonas_calceolata.AAC.6
MNVHICEKECDSSQWKGLMISWWVKGHSCKEKKAQRLLVMLCMQSRGRGGSAGCVTGGAGGAGGAGGQQAGAAAGIEQLLGRAPEAQLTLPEAPYRTVAAHKEHKMHMSHRTLPLPHRQALSCIQLVHLHLASAGLSNADLKWAVLVPDYPCAGACCSVATQAPAGTNVLPRAGFVLKVTGDKVWRLSTLVKANGTWQPHVGQTMLFRWACMHEHQLLQQARSSGYDTELLQGLWWEMKG